MSKHCIPTRRACESAQVSERGLPPHDASIMNRTHCYYYCYSYGYPYYLLKRKRQRQRQKDGRNRDGNSRSRAVDRTAAALALAGSAVAPPTLSFPLFWRGVERTKFEIAVKYLSLNVDQLLAARHVTADATGYMGRDRYTHTHTHTHTHTRSLWQLQSRIRTVELRCYGHEWHGWKHVRGYEWHASGR